jgi:hypothetical protein
MLTKWPEMPQNRYLRPPGKNKNSTLNMGSNLYAFVFDLMIHKKKEHREKVSICWNYSAGKCELGDSVCWFLHTNTYKSSEVDCNICGKIFPNIKYFLKHKKIDDVTSVEECKNERSGSCKYGVQNCWYRHNSQTNNKENNVNLEVIEKLFNMMEQFTERIFKLENQSKSK